jgi:hypothetical protein
MYDQLRIFALDDIGFAMCRIVDDYLCTLYLVSSTWCTYFGQNVDVTTRCRYRMLLISIQIAEEEYIGLHFRNCSGWDAVTQ